MHRREAPTPAAKVVLDEVRRLSRPGVVVTLSLVSQALDRPKGSITYLLNRLEAGGWIKRAKYRPGLARRIELK